MILEPVISLSSFVPPYPRGFVLFLLRYPRLSQNVWHPKLVSPKGNFLLIQHFQPVEWAGTMQSPLFSVATSSSILGCQLSGPREGGTLVKGWEIGHFSEVMDQLVQLKGQLQLDFFFFNQLSELSSLQFIGALWMVSVSQMEIC